MSPSYPSGKCGIYDYGLFFCSNFNRIVIIPSTVWKGGQLRYGSNSQYGDLEIVKILDNIVSQQLNVFNFCFIDNFVATL